MTGFTEAELRRLDAVMVIAETLANFANTHRRPWRRRHPTIDFVPVAHAVVAALARSGGAS